MDNNIKEKSKSIRMNVLRLANKSQKYGAHIAPSLSIVEILASIFCGCFNKSKDEFVLSKGHAGLAYYCAMFESSIITKEQLDSFEENGSEFPGQPTITDNNHVDFSSGSLGLGLSFASGLACSKKINNEEGRIFVLLGNGEMNEGTNYESLMFIKHHNLNNISIIIDDNNMQSDGNTDDILKVDLKSVIMGFGFEIIECDGHNEKELIDALDKQKDRLLVIIAKTIKGKGVSFMENNNDWHHNNLKDDLYNKAIEEINNG